MQSHYPAHFTREMGCVESDLERWLPGAAGPHRLTLGTRSAQVDLQEGGTLALRWQPLSPRTIAGLRFPRLEVEFRFDDLPDEARNRFMRYFDLYTQRGGG